MAADPRVAEIYAEDDSWWVSLTPGWIDRESGTHGMHEKTLAEIAERWRFITPCTCADCLADAQRNPTIQTESQTP